MVSCCKPLLSLLFWNQGMFNCYNLKNKKNLGKITFDLDADLSSLFHYNTKMLFVSILAEFENKEYKFNQACIWDDVIMDVEDSIFKLRKKKAEYMIHDLADSLAGSTANLTLQYQIIPWVGMMVTDRIVFPHALTFPSKQKK
ncbi:signal peptidase 22kDa subunit [Globomyces pollinis-pini]|nr:signal peptidase 22kDa subunit [Globomyces pollinis-pini]